MNLDSDAEFNASAEYEDTSSTISYEPETDEMSYNGSSEPQTESELPTESEPATEFEGLTESEAPTDTDINHSEVPSEATSAESVTSEVVDEVIDVDLEQPHSNNPSESIVDEESRDGVIVTEQKLPNRGSKRELEGVVEPDDSNKKQRVEEDDDEGNLCPICFDVWSNQGPHRVCCLRCGHIFGHSCLLRWFNTQPGNKKSCPTCKRKVIKSDVRFLYVKKLIAADTSEIEELRRQYVILKEEKTKLNMKINSISLSMELEIQKLQTENENLKRLANTSNSNINQQIRRQVNELRFWMDKSLEINTDGGCRVFDYSSSLKTIAVSLISPNPIFTGYGVRKIMMPEYKPTAFIAAHSKPIRDLAFNDNLLLSVSLDARAKLINMNTNCEVTSIQLAGPLWSCCWDCEDPNVFYVGEGRGTVSVYDIRNARENVSVLETEGDSSPVVSLASTPFQIGEAMPRGGLLVCKLNSCWAFGKNSSASNDFTQMPLPIDGPFMSLRYHKESKHVLISARANQRSPNIRHMLCELSQYNDTMRCNVVHTYQGPSAQSMLSRSCLVNYEDNMYIAAYHAAHKNVTIYSAKTGLKAGSVVAHSPILDVCNIRMQHSSFLCTLNEKKLDFFQIGKA